MKNFTSIILLFLCLVAYNCNPSDNNPNTFTLNGQVLNQDTGKIVLIIITDMLPVPDTAEIVDGKFVFTGTTNTPLLVNLSEAGNEYNGTSFFIEPGEMSITINHDNFAEFKITGSKSQDDQDSIDLLEKPFMDRISDLRATLTENNAAIQNSDSETEKNELLMNNEGINRQIERANKDIFDLQIRYVEENPNSIVSAELLRIRAYWDEVTLDSAKVLYNNLDKAIQESNVGVLIANLIRQKENLKIGAIVPDISFIDINNNSFEISQYINEKVILLEYWASWCQPCRRSFPQLKEIYNKYSPNGFEIIAVARFENNNETWHKAIEEEGISDWHHAAAVFLDGGIINVDFMNAFAIKGIPFSVLIDKSGKVAGYWEGYEEENELELEVKLKELL